jgi:hypothetical protein
VFNNAQTSVPARRPLGRWSIRRSTAWRIAVRGVAVSSLVALCTVSSSASAVTHSDVYIWPASGCGTHGSARTEASRQLPLRSLPGYRRVYCNDFRGSELSPGWFKFSGVPGGDPSGMFDPSHVVVADGALQLVTARDPQLDNRWATGGLCQCGRPQTYGAYFVRSRVTAGGDDNVELLWPTAHVWPPEVDFNETGNTPTKTAWYVHFSAHNSQIASTLRVNLRQWHTWGVIWTPTSLTFTVDGVAWGSVHDSSVIPHEAMTLDIQQQTWCGIAPECPTKPLSMLVDWVVEFAPAAHHAGHAR